MREQEQEFIDALTSLTDAQAWAQACKTALKNIEVGGKHQLRDATQFSFEELIGPRERERQLAQTQQEVTDAKQRLTDAIAKVEGLLPEVAVRKLKAGGANIWVSSADGNSVYVLFRHNGEYAVITAQHQGNISASIEKFKQENKYIPPSNGPVVISRGY